MSTPIRDPHLLTKLLRRTVVAVEEESRMGMRRVVALHFENGVRFPLPAGNALRSAGETAEIRALLSGLSRQVAAVIRRRVGPGDPGAAADIIDATLMTALADPDTLIEDLIEDQDPTGFPLSRS